MENIVININDLMYKVDKCNYWCPLPYGNISVKNARLFGSVLSTRGGGWRWNLPEKCIVDYKQYSPYTDFNFTGQLNVSVKENEGYTYFLRSSDRKSRWLHFDGQFKASKLYKFENILKQLNFTKWQENGQQGHLSVWSIKPNMKLYDIMSYPSVSQIVGRKRIFNHQFFGDCKIYNINKNFDFLLFVRDITYVVSPDHIDNPIILGNGFYFASHPEPTPVGVD